MLDVRNLTVSFNDGQGGEAVHDVSLHMEKGELLGLVGESGSGKTMIALTIAGLIQRGRTTTTGELWFNGKNLLACSREELRGIQGKDIGFIFQEPMTSLNPLMKVGRQIEETLKIHTDLPPRRRKELALEVMGHVELPEPELTYHKYPHQLSGGQRQRAMIASAFICDPMLLIADEPTTALDVTIQAQILELMTDLKKQLGMAIILITHDLGVVAGMCDRIAVMYGGKVVEYGATDDVFYRPSHEYTKGLLQSIPSIAEQSRSRLVPIEGSPVDMLNPPAGCPFAPRCRACMRVCLGRMPAHTKLGELHYSACWLLDKAKFEEQERLWV